MRQNKAIASEWLVLAVLLLPVLATAPVQALRDKKALLPTADTFVRSDGPNGNWGEERELWVEGNGWEMLAYLRFDLAELPADATIEEAKLRLYTSGDMSKKAPVSVYYCPNNEWTEGGITYNNKPEFAETSIDTANVTSPLTWHEWNITSVAQSTFSAEEKRLSLVLKADSDGHIAFPSTDDPFARPPNPDHRPQLVVLYNAPATGNNTVITALIIITVTVAATAAVGLTYIIMKGRKNKSRKPVQPNPLQKSTLVQQTFSLIKKNSTTLILKIQKLMIT